MAEADGEMYAEGNGLMDENGFEPIIFDATPEVASISAQQHSDMDWKLILGELVDNSFDAGASRVEIRFFLGRPAKLVVRDDGDGCDIKNLQAMIKLGSHVKHRGTRVGRHGIGLKDASWAISTKMEVETVHKSQHYTMTADWEEMKRAGHWASGLSGGTKASKSNQSWTEITFYLGKWRRRPTDIEAVSAELGFIFAPAIESGRQIFVSLGPEKRGAIVRPYKTPPMTDIIEDEFEVNGKSVSIRVGIVPSGTKNEHSGFIYQHEHRTLWRSPDGARQYSISRIAGIVRLGKGWAVSRNKTSIQEAERRALYDAIFERCETILKKADEQARELFSQAFTDTVESKLVRALGKSARRGRERRRRKKNNTGRVKPMSTGTKRVNVEKVDPTKEPTAIERMCRTGCVRVVWDDTGDIIGEACVGETSTIIMLNCNDEYLSRLRKSSDVALASDTVAVIALALYADAINNSGTKPLDGMSSMPSIWSDRIREVFQNETNGK